MKRLKHYFYKVPDSNVIRSAILAAPHPTTAQPGSYEKVEILRQRVELLEGKEANRSVSNPRGSIFFKDDYVFNATNEYRNINRITK